MICPVCGNNTFDDNDYEYEICPECFWEYDLIQFKDPNLEDGANKHSLSDYRKIYKQLKQDNPNFSCQNAEDLKLLLSIENNEISIDFNKESNNEYSDESTYD